MKEQVATGEVVSYIHSISSSSSSGGSNSSSSLQRYVTPRGEVIAKTIQYSVASSRCGEEMIKSCILEWKRRAFRDRHGILIEL